MRGWTVVGPGCGGALYRPTVSPASRDIALIACDMTGSYVTVDGGQRWRQLDFGTVAQAFAFDPAQPDTIWAGASGLWRSDDRGMHWRLVLPRPETVRGERFLGDEGDHHFVTDRSTYGSVQAVLVDPSDRRRLIVGIADGHLALLETRDQGEHFSQIASLPGRRWVGLLAGDEPGVVVAVTDTALAVIRPGGASVALRPPPPGASSVLAAARGSVLYLVAEASGCRGRFEQLLFRSPNEGESWEDCSPALEELLEGSRAVRLPCIAACSGVADTLYLSVAEPRSELLPSGAGEPFGILKSSDGGASWHWSLRLAERQPENRVLGWVEEDYAPDWGGAPFGLGVRSGDPDCCYATDWGTVYRTVDGGIRWAQRYCRGNPETGWVNRGVNVTNVYGLFHDPFLSGRSAMACTDVGLLVSDDACTSWRHGMKGIPRDWQNTCYWLVFDPEVRERAWSAWSACHDLPRAKMLRTEAYRCSPGGIARTDDGMASWQPYGAGLPRGPVTHLDLDPSSPRGSRHLLAAVFGHGVFASRDGGASWHEADRGIGSNRNAWSFCRAGATVWLLVARGAPEATTIAGALYRSRDGARSWQVIPLPAGVDFPNSLAADPDDPGRLYLACWPAESQGTQRGGGLLTSNDGGESWRRCFDESAHAYGVTAGGGGLVYLCTFEGRTWRSPDRGASWAALEGIAFRWQKTVQLDPRDPSRIYLSTFGAGLWHGPAEGPAGPARPRLRVEALDIAPGAGT